MFKLLSWHGKFIECEFLSCGSQKLMQKCRDTINNKATKKSPKQRGRPPTASKTKITNSEHTDLQPTTSFQLPLTQSTASPNLYIASKIPNPLNNNDGI